jgi:hypothetical protein
MTQPLLTIPNARPNVRLDPNVSRLLCCCCGVGQVNASSSASSGLCGTCFNGGAAGTAAGPTLSEFNLLQTRINLSRFEQRLDPNDKAGTVSAETQRLLDAPAGAVGSGAGSLDGVLSMIQQLDGMYVNPTPILTEVLLHAENFLDTQTPTGNTQTTSFDDRVFSKINLSRATQRTLRELKGALDRQKLKEQIESEMRIHATKPSKKPNENKLSRIPEDKTVAEASGKAVRSTPQHHRPVPSASLLKQQLLHATAQPGNADSTCVLSIAENPVIEQLAQPVLPEADITFGGVLGQWGSQGTAKEVLGPIVPKNTDSRQVKRSILRVHLHSIQLQAHPHMSTEELLYYNKLRAIYAKYSLVFEQRASGYLTYRLIALIVELKRIVSKHTEQQLEQERQSGSDSLSVFSDDEFNSLEVMYRDLIATIPSLCDLREVIDNMSGLLFQTYRDLQEIRQRQGFVCTKASLIAKKLKQETDSSRAVGGKSTEENSSRRRRGTDKDSGVDYQQLDHSGRNLCMRRT